MYLVSLVLVARARMTATASQKPLVCTWCRDWVLASPIPKFQENSAVSKLGKTRPGSGVPWSETSAEVEVDASGFGRLLSQIRSEQHRSSKSESRGNRNRVEASPISPYLVGAG